MPKTNQTNPDEAFPAEHVTQQYCPRWAERDIIAEFQKSRAQKGISKKKLQP